MIEVPVQYLNESRVVSSGRMPAETLRRLKKDKLITIKVVEDAVVATLKSKKKKQHKKKVTNDEFVYVISYPPPLPPLKSKVFTSLCKL